MTKFRYTYGIPGKPETYFSKVFTLDQIEGGDQFEVLENEPLMRSFRVIARDQFTGKQDKTGADVFDHDKIEFDRNEWGGSDNIHEVSWSDDYAGWDFGGGSMSDMEFRTVIGTTHQ